MNTYKAKIQLDGNSLYDISKKMVLPSDESKYIKVPWQPNYTWFKLAFMVYGSTEYFTLLLAANGITNPYESLDVVKILLPAYINEVKIE